MQEVVDRVEDKREKSGETRQKVKLLDRLKKIKHFDILVALVVLIAMLTLYFGVFTRDKQDISTSRDEDDVFLMSLERVISSIDGVGRCKIIINYDDDRHVEIAHRVESVIKVDDKGNHEVIEESREPIIIKGKDGDEPIVLNETKGYIKGVIVVASGGDDVRVKLSLIDALSTLLKVDSDKIKVYGMKKY